MRDYSPEKEQAFFALFRDYFDSEKDAGKQHDPGNYTLDRMAPLAELGGHPEKSLKVIHIAGTKGKGTTSAFTASLLASAGRQVGLFTSPHLCTVRERFQENGHLVSYERLMSVSQPYLAKVKAAGLHPSLFEIFTIIALRLFEEDGMEYAVLETGIGGRVDSTNYISHPLVTAITPVSFDHLALLGHTIEAIATEKAGIIKPGVPLVLAHQPFAAGEATIRARAAQVGATVLPPCPDDCCQGFVPDALPRFLRDNFTVARAIVQALGIAPRPERFRLPELRARFERIHTNPTVLLDGAHNADSMQKLVSALRERYPDERWNVVLGCVRGKDVSGMVKALTDLPNAQFILTNPHTGKGSALEELRLETARQGLQVIADIPDLQRREQLPQERSLLFTGSFFTASIGESLFG
ncbi:MAG: hypothetical protein IJJ33_04055 [Victivallales bacterium]|nr:hypothetical protein [Victivallales bacterium]